MLSPIFIAPLLAALQIGVIYLAKSELDQATNVVSRAVMTGQATSSSQVSTAFCGALTALIDCNSLMINLKTYNSLGAMQTGNPVLTFNPDGSVSNVWSQTFAGSGSIMVMQVVYQYPVIGYGMLQFTGQSNGMLPLVSTAVFVVE
jgi:Flp pilus assembly protein TadG